MPISFEIAGPARADTPPFSDGCPNCVTDGTVIPLATITHGDTLHAYYNHGRCGHEWATAWRAQYSHTWQRVIGSDAQRAIAA